jgi:hypothetical protein
MSEFNSFPYLGPIFLSIDLAEMTDDRNIIQDSWTLFMSTVPVF